MNMVSYVVLSIVAVLLKLSIVNFRKENIEKCGGNCSMCVYSCHGEEQVE